MPLEQHLRESRAGSAPPDARKHGHRSDKALSRNAGQRVSGPCGGRLGVAGLLLRARWLYSHHFNKEMIKRGWGGGGEKNPKHLFYFKSGKIPLLARNV